MKFFIIASLCLMHFYTSCHAMTTEDVLGVFHNCQIKTGASDADVADYKRFDPASSSEGKCFRACFMQTAGSLNSDGKFVKAIGYAISKFVANGDPAKEAIFVDTVDACLDIDVPDDHCEAAEAYTECMRVYGLEKGLLFAL